MTMSNLEEAPGHAAYDVQHVSILVVLYLHTLGVDANATGSFGRGHTHHALFSPANSHGPRTSVDHQPCMFHDLEGARGHGDSHDTPVCSQRGQPGYDQHNHHHPG